jgi:hypothetical protein
MRLQSKEYQRFRAAVLFSVVIALLLAVFVGIYGKDQSFLMINSKHSTRADYFFNYVTYLGDGLIWVPLFLYTAYLQTRFFYCSSGSGYYLHGYHSFWQAGRFCR